MYTLRVESFAGRNFRGYKLSRTPEAKIKFRGYKLSRTLGFLVDFSYFDTIFSDFSSDISRTPMKVRFRGYKLSRMAKKLAKSRNFLPAKLSTFKVFTTTFRYFHILEQQVMKTNMRVLIKAHSQRTEGRQINILEKCTGH